MRLLLGILLVCALAATALVNPAEDAYAADTQKYRPFSDYRPLTWNMQGSDHSGAKWFTVGNLASGAPATGAHNIVGLQESGSSKTLPGSPLKTLSAKEFTGDEKSPYSLVVREWNHKDPMGQTHKFYLYFMDSGGAASVGLAMVTDVLADKPIFIPPQEIPGSIFKGRPAFGLVFRTPGNVPDYFFTLHGNAVGGDAPNDSANILAAIDKTVPAGSRWAALGDYNQTPATVPISPGASISRTYTATRQGGREISFMVAKIRGGQGFPGHILRAGSSESDHWPIEFQTSSSSHKGHSPLRTREHPGECITAVKDELAPLTRCAGSKPQNWQLVGDLVVNTALGSMCLDVRGGWTDAGTPVMSYTCNGNDNQQWEYKDGTLVNLKSKRCLEPSGKDPVKLFIQDCKPTTASQQWILPSDQSTQRVQINKDRTVSVVPVSPSGKDGEATNIQGQADIIGTAIHNIAVPNAIDVFAIDQKTQKLSEATFITNTHKLLPWQEFKAFNDEPVPLGTLTDLSVSMNAHSTYVAVTGGDVGKKASVCVTRIRRTGSKNQKEWFTKWTCSPAHGLRVAAVQVPKLDSEFLSGPSADTGDSVYVFTYDEYDGKIYGRELEYSPGSLFLTNARTKGNARAKRDANEVLIALPRLPAGVDKLVSTLSGTVVHLVATTRQKQNNLYFLAMDTTSDDWRPEWQPVGTHMAGPTVTDTPGELLICGAISEKKTGCANTETTGDYRSEQASRKFRKSESPEHFTPAQGLSLWAWLGIAAAIVAAIVITVVIVVNFYAAPAVIAAMSTAFAELGGGIAGGTAAEAADAAATAAAAAAEAAAAEGGATVAEATTVSAESVGTSVVRASRWGVVNTTLGFRNATIWGYDIVDG
ncbi:ricin-type beta-trefoil lectin domain protein [Streptomyces sp. NPDC006514]|uniref:ricin-type beta-trefoil lectin domain protein n=1 Tax=Streptomyces sp. NPDC006514 TaxID=3154308 RepID=UPI0033A735A0